MIVEMNGVLLKVVDWFLNGEIYRFVDVGLFGW